MTIESLLPAALPEVQKKSLTSDQLLRLSNLFGDVYCSAWVRSSSPAESAWILQSVNAVRLPKGWMVPDIHAEAAARALQARGLRLARPELIGRLRELAGWHLFEDHLLECERALEGKSEGEYTESDCLAYTCLITTYLYQQRFGSPARVTYTSDVEGMRRSQLSHDAIPFRNRHNGDFFAALLWMEGARRYFGKALLLLSLVGKQGRAGQ